MASEIISVGDLRKTQGSLLGFVLTRYPKLETVYVVVEETPEELKMMRISTFNENDIVLVTEDATFEYKDDRIVLCLDQRVSRTNHEERWQYILQQYPNLPLIT